MLPGARSIATATLWKRNGEPAGPGSPGGAAATITLKLLPANYVRLSGHVHTTPSSRSSVSAGSVACPGWSVTVHPGRDNREPRNDEAALVPSAPNLVEAPCGASAPTG